MSKWILAVCLVVILAGCAGPLGLSMSSQEQLSRAYFYDVCNGWHVNHDPKLFDELRRRSVGSGALFTPEELGNIRQNTVHVGMTMSAAHCSWGTPEREHTSDYGKGQMTQWVYDGGSYLYIRDGKIAAVQN